MVAKLWQRNIDWGCLNKRHWQQYTYVRKSSRKKKKINESCLICTLHRCYKGDQNRWVWWTAHVADLVDTLLGKRPLWSLRHRLENKTGKMYSLEQTKIPKVLFMSHSIHTRHWHIVIKKGDVIMCNDVITYAQVIMGNGVVILPPHVFDKPLRWYWQLKGIKIYGHGIGTNGVISIPNFMKICPLILELLHVYRRTSMAKTSLLQLGITNTTISTRAAMLFEGIDVTVWQCYDITAHVRRIMSDGESRIRARL
jgi:hypothetical protein